MARALCALTSGASGAGRATPQWGQHGMSLSAGRDEPRRAERG
ncbi:hypothetical protein C7S14_1660 [Burkholderia cepacia]|nr:hypothetical protein C7S14_1660 [Burkholderia cepacia]